MAITLGIVREKGVVARAPAAITTVDWPVVLVEEIVEFLATRIPLEKVVPLIMRLPPLASPLADPRVIFTLPPLKPSPLP
jgi:hypothetical protein